MKIEFEKLNKSNYRGTSYIGKSGIEKAYEDLLHGHAGYQQVEVNAQGRKNPRDIQGASRAE